MGYMLTIFLFRITESHLGVEKERRRLRSTRILQSPPGIDIITIQLSIFSLHHVSVDLSGS